jgi:hypothetical protein
MDYKIKYLKYKNKYIVLKDLLGGTPVIGTVDRTDEIKRILVQAEGDTYAFLNTHFSNIDNYGTIIDTSRAYKSNRYESTKNILVGEQIIYFKNPDISLDYQ